MLTDKLGALTFVCTQMDLDPSDTIHVHYVPMNPPPPHTHIVCTHVFTHIHHRNSHRLQCYQGSSKKTLEHIKVF